ncbi:Uncharacterised protein [Klebsiella pneumoniae]|uniref:Uncharacterized protein n=1 Tax=Klebsiella pneumoniae TaxID=573 RepID=A0A377V264_KLEPN|nr:Uncharacterised protein [Klebsiella pneumoniae]
MVTNQGERLLRIREASSTAAVGAVSRLYCNCTGLMKGHITNIHRQGRFIQRGFALELTRLAAFDKDLTNQLLQMTGILFR